MELKQDKTYMMGSFFNHGAKKMISVYLDVLNTVTEQKDEEKFIWTHKPVFEDKHQTKFDVSSSKLKIGVIAKTEKDANILLYLLRMIVDDDYAYLFAFMEPLGYYDEFKLSKIVSYFEQSENPVKYLGDSKEIDLWNLERLRSYFSTVSLTEWQNCRFETCRVTVRDPHEPDAAVKGAVY